MQITVYGGDQSPESADEAQEIKYSTTLCKPGTSTSGQCLVCGSVAKRNHYCAVVCNVLKFVKFLLKIYAI